MPVVISGTTGIVNPDGSAGTPSLAGSDTNTGVFFPAADTVAVATGGTERVRVDSSGNVNIGGTSGNGKLNVITGNVNLTDDYSVTWGTQGAYLNGSTASNYLRFFTSSAERARIDSSGNWLFNKTSTAASGSGVCFQTNDTSQFYRGGDGQAIQFFRSSSQVGSISVTGTATAYNTSSDYRLKEEIAPMTGALAKVAALKPVTYKWKLDGSAGEGFIAHELQEVVPGCVTGEKDAVETYTDENGNEQTRPVYQGIDTSFLVATLTAAIQELKAELDSVKAELATLKGAQA